MSLCKYDFIYVWTGFASIKGTEANFQILMTWNIQYAVKKHFNFMCFPQ